MIEAREPARTACLKPGSDLSATSVSIRKFSRSDPLPVAPSKASWISAALLDLSVAGYPASADGPARSFVLDQ